MPRRLIEEAFPLKKVSEDSKHEKNPRLGHISTLHVWPARRPLAACRAVTNRDAAPRSRRCTRKNEGRIPHAFRGLSCQKNNVTISVTPSSLR